MLLFPIALSLAQITLPHFSRRDSRSFPLRSLTNLQNYRFRSLPSSTIPTDVERSQRKRGILISLALADETFQYQEWKSWCHGRLLRGWTRSSRSWTNLGQWIKRVENSRNGSLAAEQSWKFPFSKRSRWDSLCWLNLFASALIECPLSNFLVKR